MPDTLIQVAHNVWIFPRDEDPNRLQPNVGVIVADGHTVLVDAGNSPRHARRILLALDDVDDHLEHFQWIKSEIAFGGGEAWIFKVSSASLPRDSGLHMEI